MMALHSLFAAWLYSFSYFLLLVSAYSQLSDKALNSIPLFPKELDVHTGEILAPILQVRIPGTPGIETVRQHFLQFFKESLPLWKIELQNSTQPTALGVDILFSNIVATRDPPWAREGDTGRLALVAHYDSKLTPQGFIGATDSAAPCAAILAAAKSIDAALTKKWDDMKAKGMTGGGLEDDEQGIQILLLDGEEAFLTWTHDDSLYGARALAQDWDTEMNPAMSTYHSKLSQISLFLLLDLLGAKDPQLPSYFQTTHWAYKNMAALERRLRKLGLFRSSPADHPARPWFPDAEIKKDEIAKHGGQASWYGGAIEDDHIPFMARGIEILHMIPNPFPWMWHKIEDDGDHLDQATVEDWATLTAAFAAEWLELDQYMHGAPAAEARGVEEEKSEL